MINLKRNTNGFSLVGKLAALTGVRNEVRPIAGALRQSDGLLACVSKVGHEGLTADVAEELSKLACQSVGIPLNTTLNARPQGQDRRFLKAVRNRLCQPLGFGRGPTPHVMAPFEPPNKPESVKLTGGHSRLHSALPWVFRAQAAQRAAQTKSVNDKLKQLKVDSRVASRDAQDLETALANKRKQYGGVSALLGRGIEGCEAELDQLKLKLLEVSQRKTDAESSVTQHKTTKGDLENSHKDLTVRLADLHGQISKNRQAYETASKLAAQLNAPLILSAKPPKSADPISTSRPSYRTELGPKGQIKLVRVSAPESSRHTPLRERVTRHGHQPSAKLNASLPGSGSQRQLETNTGQLQRELAAIDGGSPALDPEMVALHGLLTTRRQAVERMAAQGHGPSVHRINSGRGVDDGFINHEIRRMDQEILNRFTPDQLFRSRAHFGALLSEAKANLLLDSKNSHLSESVAALNGMLGMHDSVLRLGCHVHRDIFALPVQAHPNYHNWDQLLKVDASLVDLSKELETLNTRCTELKARLTDHEENLKAVKDDIKVAESANFSAKLEVDRVHRAISRIEGKPGCNISSINSNASRFKQSDMGQLPRLREALKAVQDEAKAQENKEEGAAQSFLIKHAKSVQTEAQVRMTQRIEQLVGSPPGFEAHNNTQQLQNLLTELADRLDSLPQGILEKDVDALLRKRAPRDKVLEIVSRYLAEVTNGDAVEAASTLASLMARSFANLVPQPGCNFIEQRISEDPNADDSGSIEKHFISLVADCPGGVELLKRLVKPGRVVSREVRDAVIVYYRASRALAMPPADPISLERLQLAEEAAKIVAQFGEYESLNNRKERINFNAVRNGFTSFGPGSDYAVAGAALVKFADQWISRARGGEAKRTPLQATQRRFAAKVAADVHFPTHETLLNKMLLEACDEAQKFISIELRQARLQVIEQRAQQRRGPQRASAARVPEVLLQAQSLIAHIQACAKQGQRIDTKRLGYRDWLSINRQAAILAQSELTASSPAWRDLKDRSLPTNGVNHLRGHARAAIQEPQSFPELKNAVSGMKPNLIQALSLRGRGTTVLDALEKLVTNLPDELEKTLGAELKALEALEALEKEKEKALRAELNALPDSSATALPDLEAAAGVTGREVSGLTKKVEEKRAELEKFKARKAQFGVILKKAKEKEVEIDQFSAKPDKFTGEALENWITPALLEGYEPPKSETTVSEATVSETTDSKTPKTETPKTVTPDYGSMTFLHGRQRGFSAGTLFSGLAGIVTGGAGWVARPELEGIQSTNDQVRFGRDASGMSILMGRAIENSFTLGGSAASLFSPGKMPALGPAASLIHTWSKSTLKGGAVIRVPRADDRDASKLSGDMSTIMKTLAAYKKPPGAEADDESLIDTLLGDHQSISVTTVDKEETRTHKASSRLGGFLGFIYPRPVGRSALFWSGVFGAEFSNQQERRSYKTTAGAQGYLTNTQSAKGATDFVATTIFRHGYVQNRDSNINGARGDLGLASAKLSWSLSSASSGTSLISQPDGTVIGDRFVEYSDYERFEKAVNSHREKWIESGIKLGDREKKWPKEFDETDKRIHSERALMDFMESARQSLAARTVTFQENLDVKQEVSSQLTANIALEQLARRQGRDADALALQAEREYILSQESSYQPFQLKVIASSKISQPLGFNIGYVQGRTSEASAKRNYDYFPRLSSVPLDTKQDGSTLENSSPSLSNSARENSDSPGDIDLPVDGFPGGLVALNGPGIPSDEYWLV